MSRFDEALRELVRDEVRSVVRDELLGLRAPVPALPSDLLTVGAVADRCGVQPATVRVWIREKQLNAVRIGQQFRIRSSDLDAFLEARAPVDDDVVGASVARILARKKRS